MSLLSKFWGRLFSKEAEKPPPPKPKVDYMARWEQERAERITSAEGRLKDWIVAALRIKETLPFSWESGGDEAFVTFEDSSEADRYNMEDLEEYIVNKLDIPDAGEFKMNGSGTLYIQGNVVKAKYSSVMKEIVDYDEETEEEIYGEQIADSEDKILFSV